MHLTITGIIFAIVVGLVIAAWIGDLIAAALGYTNANGGVPWAEIVFQVVVAAVAVLVTVRLYARRGVRH